MKRVLPISVSDAELEVMEMLWDQKSAIKQSQLLTLFNEDGKTWKRQTLNTFLSRLEDKGLIKRENRLVEPLCGREEYYNMQMKAVIERMYGGSSKSILIIDTPKSCKECVCSGENVLAGTRCECWCNINGWQFDVNKFENSKPEWCHFKEMKEESV